MTAVRNKANAASYQGRVDLAHLRHVRVGVALEYLHTHRHTDTHTWTVYNDKHTGSYHIPAPIPLVEGGDCRTPDGNPLSCMVALIARSTG